MLKKKFFKTKTECEVLFELSPKGAQQVWVSDENADGCQPNQFGGTNSILDTSPPELPS